MTDRDELLRPSDVESEFSVCESTLATMRARGDGPAWFRLGGRRVVYRRSAVESWIAAAETERVAS